MTPNASGNVYRHFNHASPMRAVPIQQDEPVTQDVPQVQSPPQDVARPESLYNDAGGTSPVVYPNNITVLQGGRGRFRLPQFGAFGTWMLWVAVMLAAAAVIAFALAQVDADEEVRRTTPRRAPRRRLDPDEIDEGEEEEPPAPRRQARRPSRPAASRSHSASSQAHESRSQSEESGEQAPEGESE